MIPSSDADCSRFVVPPDPEMNSMCSWSLSRRRQSRRGGVTPLAILSIALLVGVVALTVDGGTLMEARRHVQATADAAALAGAGDLYANYNSNQGIDVAGSAQASALSTASANGFLNDGVQSTVTVSTSPQNYQGGPNAGKPLPAGYIEVIIQYNASHLFSGVFGASTTPVRARAVARGRCAPISSNNGVYALNLNVASALNVTNLLGGLSVNPGIQVNSGSSQAVTTSLLAKITTPLINLNSLVGGLLSAILSLLSGPASVTSCPPLADPLRYLPVPDPVQLGLTTRGNNLTISSGTVDLYPGVYNGGIKVSSTATVILHANSDGTPGIYYMSAHNGFQVTGFANVKTAAGETAGVMIYNDWIDASAVIKLSTLGTVSIIPPASGIYRGLTIFQKRGTHPQPAPTMAISASGNLQVAGTIYAAYANVTLSGSSASNLMGGQIIADAITTSGTTTLNVNPGSQPTANQRILGLVE